MSTLRSYGDWPSNRDYDGGTPHRAPGADHPVADYPDCCPEVELDRWDLDGVQEPELVILLEHGLDGCRERYPWLPERRRVSP